jgi:hypothetical protein
MVRSQKNYVTSYRLREAANAGIVRLLEREKTEKGYLSSIVLVGKSDRLQILDMNLRVPQGIDVYQVACEHRFPAELFFAARGDSDLGPAYMFVVKKDGGGNLNYDQVTAELLRCPGYSNDASSDFFEMFSRGNGPKKSTLYAREPQEVAHSLLQK